MFTFSLPLMIVYTVSCWMTGYFFRKCTRENTSIRHCLPEIPRPTLQGLPENSIEKSTQGLLALRERLKRERQIEQACWQLPCHQYPESEK